MSFWEEIATFRRQFLPYFFLTLIRSTRKDRRKPTEEGNAQHCTAEEGALLQPQKKGARKKESHARLVLSTKLARPCLLAAAVLQMPSYKSETVAPPPRCCCLGLHVRRQKQQTVEPQLVDD